MSRKNKNLKNPMIMVSTMFVLIMLVLPLMSVIINSLSKGIGFYMDVLLTHNVISALKVTIFVTVITILVNSAFGLVASWALTRFSFRGKHVLSALIDIPFSVSPVVAGLAFIMVFGRMGWAAPVIDWINTVAGWDIKIVFAVPGVVLATIFVSFSFVLRELVPVLNSVGTDEEEAAALMGAKGFTIFRKITFPHIKWAFLYGIILCTARALGEFGAVNALSRTRGKTFTLPLEIDALYLSGSVDSIVAAYAVSSILVILAVIMLVVRSILEYRTKRVKYPMEVTDAMVED